MPAYINGQQVNGCTNYASAVTCVDKDGNKSTVQAEMDELNKKIAVVTGNFSNTAGLSTEIPYPNGFNFDNCFIQAFEVKHGANWRSGDGIFTANERIFAQLSTTGISAYTHGDGIGDYKFRVILCKF